jgi:3-hydroxy-9,10-secoandrosta-1,3,5(10)-triene-9,17-dione monooxygenase reductase component
VIQGRFTFQQGSDRALAPQFTEVLRALPSGVCLVTAIGPDGPAGLTAGSVSALSPDPLLMVVGIRSSSRTLAAARAAGSFAINVLAVDQAGVALRFASRRAGRDKYADIPHRLESGAPVIDDAPAWLVCELRASHPEGDHELVVGRVRAMGRHTGARRPLVSHGGRLTTVADSPPAR